MKRTNVKSKVIGYLRVSTIDQDTAKNENDVLRYANQNDFGKVEFISEKISGMKSWKSRKLFEVVQNMQPGDKMIVPELSRLGRSLVDVLEVLKELTDRGVKVYSVKENFQLNGDDMQSKIMRTLLGLFAEIEKDLISSRTKEGLQAAREKGSKLGRKKGSFNSKLDKFKPEIIKQLNDGIPMTRIAKRHDCTTALVSLWVKKHGIKINKD